VLLEDKYAVIYGDGGKVGGAVAFACEGAKVVLTGRRAVEQAKSVGTTRGEPMNSKLVFSAPSTEDILIANESCGGAPSLETEYYV
jgi:hypothetical protein